MSSSTHSRLRRLAPDGRRFVTEPFLRGERESAPEELSDYTDPVDVPGDVDLDGLDASLGDIMYEYDAYDSAIDAAAAEHVHRHLDVSRRTASDMRIWHYLTVDRYPDFVRHRWKFTSKSAMREKFLGSPTDLQGNALHRLWWIAELTVEGDDYTLTRTALSNQTLTNKIFDRELAKYRPLAIACTELLAGEPSDLIETVTLRLNHALTNLQLEGLTEDEIRDVVGRILEDVKTG